MGQCVVRDCGFDLERKNDVRDGLLSEEVVKHKIPLLKKRGITKDAPTTNSEEEKDIYKEMRKKYRQKNKLKTSFSESKSKKDIINYQEFQIRSFKKDSEMAKEEIHSIPFLQEVSTGIKQDPQQTVLRPTPNFKEMSLHVEYANKPTLAKKPKYAYTPQTVQETVKRGRLSIYKESGDGARHTVYHSSARSLHEENVQESPVIKKNLNRSYTPTIRKRVDSLHVSDQNTQEQSSKYTQDKGSMFEETELSYRSKSQKAVTREVIVMPKSIRGKIIAFENIFFRDQIKGARSISNSPREGINLLPDEISDTDFDFNNEQRESL